ncbi:hypothetical protein BDW69DRAFT_174617 [Aspergillus filifer]
MEYVLDRYLDGTVDGYTRPHCQDADPGELQCDACDPDWMAQEIPVSTELSPAGSPVTASPSPQESLDPGSSDVEMDQPGYDHAIISAYSSNATASTARDVLISHEAFPRHVSRAESVDSDESIMSQVPRAAVPLYPSP